MLTYKINTSFKYLYSYYKKNILTVLFNSYYDDSLCHIDYKNSDFIYYDKCSICYFANEFTINFNSTYPILYNNIFTTHNIPILMTLYDTNTDNLIWFNT